MGARQTKGNKAEDWNIKAEILYLKGPRKDAVRKQS